MMSCNFPPDQIVATVLNHVYHYSDFNASIALNATCLWDGGETYIRPDSSGALLPWLYAIIILVIHLPTVLIRVTRWEKVQVLSLWLAVSSIAVTLQGYISTGLEPEAVLVWMPLLLPLDAGAMLQLIVLIVEDVGFRPLCDGLKIKRWRVSDEMAARECSLPSNDLGCILTMARWLG